MIVVDELQFFGPVIVFMYLVYEQVFASLLGELVGEFK